MNAIISLVSRRFLKSQITDLVKVLIVLVLAIVCRYVLTGGTKSEVDGAQNVHATFVHPVKVAPVDPTDLATADF